jgi:hypothetical protein
MFNFSLKLSLFFSRSTGYSAKSREFTSTGRRFRQSAANGWGRDVLSLAVTVQNLVWGVI